VRLNLYAGLELTTSFIKVCASPLLQASLTHISWVAPSSHHPPLRSLAAAGLVTENNAPTGGLHAGKLRGGVRAAPCASLRPPSNLSGQEKKRMHVLITLVENGPLAWTL
jgi:hypothetical protein